MCDAMGVREGETASFVLVRLRMKCGRLFQLGPKTCYTLCHQHQQQLKLGQMKCRIGRRRENVEKEKATSNEMKWLEPVNVHLGGSWVAHGRQGTCDRYQIMSTRVSKFVSRFLGMSLMLLLKTTMGWVGGMERRKITGDEWMKEWIDWWEDRGMLLEGNGELWYIESGCYFQSIMGDSLVWCPCEKMHVQCTEQTALKGIRRDIADAIQFPSIRVISLPKACQG